MPSYNMKNEKKPISNDLMPEGQVALTVIDVEEKTSKAGAPMLVWTLMSDEGLCTTLYTVCTEGKRWAMKEMLSACSVNVADGEVYTFELEQLKGKNIIGVNKHIKEPYINRDGVTIEQEKNKFTKFMPNSQIPF